MRECTEIQGRACAEMLVLEECRGRVHVHMTVQRMGGDYAVTLGGGDAHVGAVALGLPPRADESGETSKVSAAQKTCVVETRANHEASVESLTVPGHREDELARSTALYMAKALNARVCVACGIHLDTITSAEIALVLTLADKLMRRAVAAVQKKADTARNCLLLLQIN